MTSRFLIFVCVFPSVLLAANVEYSAGLTFARYSNINHQYVPDEEEYSQALRGYISLDEGTNDFKASAIASGAAVKYTNGLVEDEASAQFAGNTLLYLINGRFEWFVADIYTQTTIDVLTSNVPNNRQNANAFSTGPNFIFFLGRRNNIVIESRVQDFYYESSVSDNQRLSNRIEWEYGVNSSINTNLGISSDNVSYDEINNSDYNRLDFYLNVLFHHGRNLVDMEAGATNIGFEAGNDISESRYNIFLQNQRTRSSRIELRYNHILTDTSNDLQRLVETTSAIQNSIGTITTSEDIYLNNSFEVLYAYSSVSSEFSLTAGRMKSDYINNNSLDEKSNMFRANQVINISDYSSIGFEMRYVDSDFINIIPVRVDIDRLYALTYRRNLGRNTSFSLRGEYQERDSTIIQQNYDNAVVFITLEYGSR